MQVYEITVPIIILSYIQQLVPNCNEWYTKRITFHLPVGVFGIEVSAQAALQDGTVVAELTVQIPSVSSYNIFHMLLVKLQLAGSTITLSATHAPYKWTVHVHGLYTYFFINTELHVCMLNNSA